VRLIIIDDHSLFRSGLVNLFNTQSDFEVVGEAGTIKEGLQLVEMQHPDLILMDVGLPDGSGIDIISKILQIKQDAKIVILTIHSADKNIFTAIRHGAKGFLIKDIPAPALLTALRGLDRGELAVPRAKLSRFVEEFMPFLAVNGSDKVPGEITLTRREMDVLAALGAGDSNEELATRLSISENTAKVHVHNILQKLDLRNRQDAAAYAQRLGLMHMSSEP